MNSSTRIIANTVSSYGRLIAVSCSTLISIPIAIRVLGPSDFGIFVVVAGCLSLLLFINGALISGAQRHIAYAMGERDDGAVREWLHASIAVHFVLALSIVLLALCFANIIIYHVLSFPAARLNTALWIYRMVIVAIGLNVFSAPYQGFLIASESIVPLSVINIGSDAFLLVGTILFGKFPGDHLMWYGGIYACSQSILYAGPVIYCIARYSECRGYKLKVTGRQVRELLSFSGWNLIGAFSSVARAQGPAVLFNLFLGTIGNAAYGLALQVNNFAVNIGSGISRATISPIIKRKASNDRKGMEDLTNLTSIASFGILWIALAPFLFEAPYCLGLWLHRVPALTSGFVVILLISTLIDQLTAGFIATAQAVGKIALYQVLVGGANILAVPLMYVSLRSGFSPIMAQAVCTVCVVIAGGLRVWLASSLAGFSVREWAIRVMFPACVSVLAGGAICGVVMHLMGPGLIRVGMLFVGNACAGAGVMWIYGLTGQQKMSLKEVWRRTLHCQAPMGP